MVLNGPNLDRLGKREPEIYGRLSLEDIQGLLVEAAEAGGHSVASRQSNHEGELVSWIGGAEAEGFDGILLNAAAYTHTSLALLDAILAQELPVIEVHLSNPQAREAYRSESRIARACVGAISGFRARSYVLAFHAMVGHLSERR